MPEVTEQQKRGYTSKTTPPPGTRYGRLVLIAVCGRAKNGGKIWRCTCDCGNVVEIDQWSMRSGATKSCGCYSAEIRPTLGRKNKTHGATINAEVTVEYTAWISMKARCYNPKHNRYTRYGARGIKVCDRWNESFENFLADMGLRPSDKHSVERKDVDQDYSPDNCVWATAKEQARNRITTRYITVGNITKSLAAWAEQSGINPGTIAYRIKRGWDPKTAVTKPVR